MSAGGRQISVFAAGIAARYAVRRQRIAATLTLASAARNCRPLIVRFDPRLTIFWPQLTRTVAAGAEARRLHATVATLERAGTPNPRVIASAPAVAAGRGPRRFLRPVSAVAAPPTPPAAAAMPRHRAAPSTAQIRTAVVDRGSIDRSRALVVVQRTFTTVRSIVERRRREEDSSRRMALSPVRLPSSGERSAGLDRGVRASVMALRGEDSRLRALSTAPPAVPIAIDRLADQVIQQIDNRLVAFRERMGRAY